MADLRVGTAFDAHRLVADRPLVLGGVTIPSPAGLEGHSDADIVCHVLCDAALGAAAMGDLGRLFPGTPEWRDAASIDLLARAFAQLAAVGFTLVNADCVVVLQEPKIAPYVDEMRARVAIAMRSTAALGIPESDSESSSRWTENGVKNSPQLGGSVPSEMRAAPPAS